jgi:hypothetical protein
MADIQEIILTDGVDTFRIQARDGVLATDQALTALGFNGTESTDNGVTGDWVNWEEIPGV